MLFSIVFSIYVICSVHGLYFTMTDMNLTLPLFRTETLDRNAIVDLYYQDGNFPTFNMNNEMRYFKISPFGELLFTDYSLHKKNLEALNTITAIVLGSDLTSTDETSLKIDLLPLNTAVDCDVMIENLCFWTSVKYRIKENRPSTVLGSLSDPYLHRMCPDYLLTYSLHDGLNRFILMPPSRNKTVWQIQTSESLDRDVPPVPTALTATCVIQSPKGTIREISRNLTIEVLDEDDNLPISQEKHFNISMPKNIVQEGQRVERNQLLLQDDDTFEVNKYKVRILHDYHRVLQPLCDDYPINHRFKKTVLHCKLEFTKDFHFEMSNYTVELEIIDVNYVGKKKSVRVPINIHFNNMSDLVPAAYTLPAMYPNQELKILRTAGPFARVAHPRPDQLKGVRNFKIKQHNGVKLIFNITQTEGIVFVQDHLALEKRRNDITLNITWRRNGIEEHTILRVEIIEEPTHDCRNVDVWSFCSEFDQFESCTHRNVCAIGTGGYNSVNKKNALGFHRCEWRGDINPPKELTTLYSTCTPDSKTCPDGICDSLENLNDSICPQDCAVNIVFPTSRNSRTMRGISSASGVCICTQLGSCHCEVPKKKKRMHVSTQTNLIKDKGGEKFTETYNTTAGTNVTMSGLLGHVSKCGTFCIIGLVAGVFVLGAIVAFIVLCWRLHTVNKAVHEKFGNMNNDMTAPLSEYTRSDGSNMTLPIQFNMTTSLVDKSLINLIKKYEPDPKWEFPRTQLEIEQTLGEGEFGRVLRAKATSINGQSGTVTVAVKTLKDDARETELNDLLSEYQLLKEVSHPNVIKLLGVCTTPGGPVYLIIEYAEFGALRTYLRRSRNIRMSIIAQTPEEEESKTSHYDEPKTCHITPKEILSFAWQICNGMAYLSSIKLVHRDLAARNILLAADKVCKISDFGLTRDIYEDNAYFKRSKGRVPVKWMAPESLQDHIYTTKSDVWSFGVLLWELVTLGASPYPGIAVQNLFHLLKQGYRMERPNNCSTKLYEIMRKCWEILPENRPHFQELSVSLEKMLGDGVEYMDLSDIAIQNKSYFMSPFDDFEVKLNNELNYLGKSEPIEKCGGIEKFVPQIVETLEKESSDIINYENTTNIQQGYETPINMPRVLKTPSNEQPQYYTDMARGNEKTK